MRLSLARIGWKMTNFVTLVSDFGEDTQLTMIPPALLKKFLRAAVYRQLERESCAKYGLSSSCDRLCYDIVRNQLRSKRWSAKAKGSIRSLTCDALWTHSRAIQAGYQLADDRCDMCGQLGDTPFHRLWRCPCFDSVRSELIDQYILDAAAAADPTDPLTEMLYCRGLFPHPGDVFPRPAGEDSGIQARHVWHEPPPDDGDFRGPVFIDGSCHRHQIVELSRAAYGVSLLDDSGHERCTIYAPVFAPFLQTPQCGEFAALARAGVEVTGPSDIYSDCKNVVDLARAPRELQMSYKRPYAGLMMIYRHGSDSICSVAKVKAHLGPDGAGIFSRTMAQSRQPGG